MNLSYLYQFIYKYRNLIQSYLYIVIYVLFILLCYDRLFIAINYLKCTYRVFLLRSKIRLRTRIKHRKITMWNKEILLNYQLYLRFFVNIIFHYHETWTSVGKYKFFFVDEHRQLKITSIQLKINHYFTYNINNRKGTILVLICS